MKTIRLRKKWRAGRGGTVREKLRQSPLVDTETVMRSMRELSTTSRISTEDMFDWLSGANAPVLEIFSPGEEPKLFPLSGEEVTIGRDQSNRLPIPFPNVSRRHARVIFQDEEYRLEDLDSTNGTFVNGIRIKRCVLRNNDQIRIGSVRMVFAYQRIARAEK